MNSPMVKCPVCTKRVRKQQHYQVTCGAPYCRLKLWRLKQKQEAAR